MSFRSVARKSRSRDESGASHSIFSTETSFVVLLKVTGRNFKRLRNLDCEREISKLSGVSTEYSIFNVA